MINFEFAGCSLHDLLLDRALCDQAIDNYFTLLADSVSSINSLEVNLGVPVRIKNDHNVG